MLEIIHTHHDLATQANEHELLLVFFYKPDSAISMETYSVLRKMEEENGAVAIGVVDVGTVHDIHPLYGIDAVPTVLVFRHGKPAEVIKGRQRQEYYTKLLTRYEARSLQGGAAVNRVTVYTTPTCRYCTAVKTYLHEKSVPFKEVDIAANPAEAERLVARTGRQGVPQIDINGRYVVGFDRQEIDRLLTI